MSAAIDALSNELSDRESELKRVQADTAEAITLGRRAQDQLNAATRARDEVAEAIGVLQSHQHSKEIPE